MTCFRTKLCRLSAAIAVLTALAGAAEAQMKPGSRIVTYRFPILGWKPDKVVTLEGDDIYLWIIPPRPSRRGGTP